MTALSRPSSPACRPTTIERSRWPLKRSRMPRQAWAISLALCLTTSAAAGSSGPPPQRGPADQAHSGALLGTDAASLPSAGSGHEENQAPGWLSAWRDIWPSRQQVRSALERHPQLLAAEAFAAAKSQEMLALRQGPSWQAKAEWQRRVVSAQGASSSESFKETRVGLERAWRSGTQRSADEQVAAHLQRAAIHRQELAEHELTRQFLKLWMDIQRTRALLAMWEDAVLQDEERLTQTRRRHQLGDASKLDQWAREGETLLSRKALLKAQGDHLSAQEAMRIQFPDWREGQNGASETGRWSASTLAQLATVTPEGHWLESLVARDHGLHQAQAHLAVQEAHALQAGAARSLSPVLGLSMGRERGGQERVIGVSFSVPLGQQAIREAGFQSALSSTQEARWLLEDAGREARILAHRRLQDLASAQAGWVLCRQALAYSQDSFRANERGVTLGELSRADLTLARKQLLEDRAREIEARFDFLEAAGSVFVDLHWLWPSHEE